MRSATRSLRWVSVGLMVSLGACRCGEDPSRPHAYDVGVPLDELPRSAVKAALDVVPPDALAVAETTNLRDLVHAAAATPEATAVARAGILEVLAVTRAGSTLSALAQRLNDLSRAPMGEEILDGVLDGPVTLAVRPGAHGSLDVLAVKPLPISAKTALRFATMLEGVHPSAQQVRVERHRGIPIRHLRLDAERTLYYFVLRDLLVLGTELGWVTIALDRALGDAHAAGLSPALVQARTRCAGALGYAIIDAQEARDVPALGLGGRALAGWQWAALRYSTASGLELGVRRARGAFRAVGDHLNIAHGTALVAEREATLDELLAVSPPAVTALPADGGVDPTLAARALLTDAVSALSPHVGSHVLYALTASSDANGPPRHTLALEASDAAEAERAFVKLTPRLFRQVPKATPDGESCVGTPAALCATATDGALALTSGAWPARAWFGAKAPPTHLDAAALALYVDPPLLVGMLGGTDEATHLVATALQGTKPRWVRAAAPDGSPEAWGRVGDLPASAP